MQLLYEESTLLGEGFFDQFSNRCIEFCTNPSHHVVSLLFTRSEAISTGEELHISSPFLCPDTFHSSEEHNVIICTSSSAINGQRII